MNFMRNLREGLSKNVEDSNKIHEKFSNQVADMGYENSSKRPIDELSADTDVKIYYLPEKLVQPTRSGDFQYDANHSCVSLTLTGPDGVPAIGRISLPKEVYDVPHNTQVSIGAVAPSSRKGYYDISLGSPETEYGVTFYNKVDKSFVTVNRTAAGIVDDFAAQRAAYKLAHKDRDLKDVSKPVNRDKLVDSLVGSIRASHGDKQVGE